MRIPASRYHRHRFPAEIISHCVWLYFRFALSFRDVEEMLAERGVVLTYETIRAASSSLTKPSAHGASSSARLMPTTYDGDLRGLAISGTSTKCSSRLTEAFIIYGVRLTRMAKFWT